MVTWQIRNTRVSHCEMAYSSMTCSTKHTPLNQLRCFHLSTKAKTNKKKAKNKKQKQNKRRSPFLGLEQGDLPTTVAALGSPAAVILGGTQLSPPSH